MKKYIVVLAGAFILASCDTPSGVTTSVDNATTDNTLVTTTTVTVPPTMQTAFITRYPTAANIEWRMYDATTVPIEWSLTDWPMMDSKDYVVTYTMDNNNYYAWYDSDGNWIGSSYVVRDFTALPAAVNATISSKYAGYTVSSAHLENWKDRTAYEVELKNATTKVKMLIDPMGNIIKEKSKAL